MDLHCQSDESLLSEATLSRHLSWAAIPRSSMPSPSLPTARVDKFGWYRRVVGIGCLHGTRLRHGRDNRASELEVMHVEIAIGHWQFDATATAHVTFSHCKTDFCRVVGYVDIA